MYIYTHIYIYIWSNIYSRAWKSCLISFQEPKTVTQSFAPGYRLSGADVSILTNNYTINPLNLVGKIFLRWGVWL